MGTSGTRGDWVKASASGSHIYSNCLRMRAAGERIEIMDDENPSVVISCTRAAFAAFLDGAKNGEFDHLLRGAPIATSRQR